MATLTIEIGRKGKKGTRCVNFLVCHGKTKKRISTEIYVNDSDMSSNGKRIVNSRKARLIEEMRRKLEDRMFALSIDLLDREDIDAAYIAEHIVQHSDRLDFFAFADEWLASTRIKGKKNYITMLSSLEKYLDKRSLPFEEITYNMLKRYEEYLRDKPRARSLYLGEIRHLFREAMRRYNTDYEQQIKNDPFMRYSVPRQQLKKGVRSITLDEFLRIYKYEAKGGSRAQLGKDCFVMSFALMGMNSVDMYELRNYRSGRIAYNRAKTKDRRTDGAYIEVWVHDIIKPIMARYKGNSRVFNFYERYKSESDFNRAINIGLKKVGEDLGIANLQFYQARHTFATLSRNLMKFSKSDVDEALNHVGSMSIADVYITKDFNIINENNFKLLDRIFA